MTERLIRPDCTGNNPAIEHELAAVSDFFSRACVPGKWAPDDRTDQIFSNLNSLFLLLSLRKIVFFLQSRNMQIYAPLVAIHSAVLTETIIPVTKALCVALLKDWVKWRGPVTQQFGASLG